MNYMSFGFLGLFTISLGFNLMRIPVVGQGLLIVLCVIGVFLLFEALGLYYRELREGAAERCLEHLYTQLDCRNDREEIEILRVELRRLADEQTNLQSQGRSVAADELQKKAFEILNAGKLLGILPKTETWSSYMLGPV